VVTGALYVDLTRTCPEDANEEARLDRHALQVLEGAPDGARVIVDIGRRQFVSTDVAVWLFRHGGRLLIEIVAHDPAALHRVVGAARSGEWSVVP
jgi:hypothetical protein